jgi:uncharacterized protein involved in exopolysaccharide biosynthesis
MQEEEAAAKKDPQEVAVEAPKKVVSQQALREGRDMEGQIRKLQSLMEAREMEAEDAKKEITRVNGQIQALNARVEQTPLGEKEYLDMMREREMARQTYEDLNRKKSVSQIASDLEQRQQGETLELLDPASLPQTPVEPKRPVIIALGTVLGLMLGVFLAGAREMKDSSLKNLKDVRAYTQLTILGSIPLLENDLVVRRRRRLGWLAWATAVLLGLLVMSGAVYFYYFVPKT